MKVPATTHLMFPTMSSMEQREPGKHVAVFVGVFEGVWVAVLVGTGVDVASGAVGVGVMVYVGGGEGFGEKVGVFGSDVGVEVGVAVTADCVGVPVGSGSSVQPNVKSAKLLITMSLNKITAKNIAPSNAPAPEGQENIGKISHVSDMPAGTVTVSQSMSGGKCFHPGKNQKSPVPIVSAINNCASFNAGPVLVTFKSSPNGDPGPNMLPGICNSSSISCA